MSSRLQVVVSERELAQLRRAAKRRGVSVSAWARAVLEAAARQEPGGNVERKLAVVRAAAAHAAPVGDVDEMLREIARGYDVELPT